MLDGPTEYVDATWMWSLHGFPHGIKWITFHGHLDCFQKPPLGSSPNTKSGDHDTPNTHNRWFILFHHARRPAWIEIHWNSIWLTAPVTYDFTLHLRVCDHTTRHWRVCRDGGLWTTFIWTRTISWSRLLARVCVKWTLVKGRGLS